MYLKSFFQLIKHLVDVTIIICHFQTFTNFFNFEKSILNLGIESLINFGEHSQDVNIVLQSQPSQVFVISLTHKLFQLKIFIFEELRGDSKSRKGVWVVRMLAEVFDRANWPVYLV